MLTDKSHTTFHVVSAPAIREILSRDLAGTIQTVGQTYLIHEDGQTTNPDSYFLRFPDDASKRIIALPAAIHTGEAISGVKWIASYPRNVQAGLQRASAVLVLNDPDTGYPLAVLECSIISAVRTAASAVLGAFWLNGQKRETQHLSVIGGGVIARHIIQMFAADRWRLEKVLIHDVEHCSADHLAKYTETEAKFESVVTNLDDALAADIVVFATNAGEPYVRPPFRFRSNQVVLNISLRDISPEIIVSANNIFDDVTHCLKANTSPHLTELKYGHRDFVTGTIAQVMRSHIRPDREKSIIYSPFGMGILDLAVGQRVLKTAILEGRTQEVPDFLGEMLRWS